MSERFQNRAERRAFTKKIRLERFCDADFSAWSFGGAVKGIALVTTFRNAPQKPIGGKCLEIARAHLPARLPAEASRTFSPALDLRACPVLSVAVNTHGCIPGGKQHFLTLTATDGRAEFSQKFVYACDRWNVLRMDLSACPFLGSVSALRFVFTTDATGDVPWDGCMQIGEILAGEYFDLHFEEEGNTQGFTAEGGTLSAADDALILTAEESVCAIGSPTRRYNRNDDPIYHVGSLKNTICLVLCNEGAAEAEVRFRTARGGSGSCRRELSPVREYRLYEFFFGDDPAWGDDVVSFRIVFSGMERGARVRIDEIAFREERKEGALGTFEASALPDHTVTVRGEIFAAARREFAGGTLVLHAVTPDEERGLVLASAKLDRLCGGVFAFEGVPFLRNEKKTLLDYDLLLLLEKDGRETPVCERKGIGNWRELFHPKYAFPTPDLRLNVREFGAKGDGFTDDTAAIQAAVDAATALGGAQVTLGGGRVYLATRIVLKDGVALVIERGSELRQCDDLRCYRYPVELGHDSKNFSYITWGSTQLVSNFPLIYARGAKRIKVTGGGRIRMSDCNNISEDLIERDFPLDLQFEICRERLHIIPIGFYDVEDAEISDLEIVRCSGFHIAYYFSRRLTLANVRLHEARCASGDGVSLFSSRDVEIFRLSFLSNDDGVVLVTTYNEPRGVLWFFPKPGEDESVENVDVRSSYINSGGGKAIAFISWGSDSPDPEKAGIRNITVRDCTLIGGFSVGTWADNPYHGKFPFDNTETDDFSCVQEVVLLDNDYRSPCDLSPNLVTGLISDCGLHSQSNLVNADFSAGLNYWKREGKVSSRGGAAVLDARGGTAALSQGLNLARGSYRFSAETQAEGEFVLFVREWGEEESVFPLGTEAGRQNAEFFVRGGETRVGLRLKDGTGTFRNPNIELCGR